MIGRKWWGLKRQDNYRSTMDYILLEHGVKLEEDPDLKAKWEEKVQVSIALWLSFLWQ